MTASATTFQLRSNASTTLASLRETLSSDGTETVEVASQEIRLNLTGDTPTIAVGRREVPGNTRAITALGAWLNVPESFLKRVHKEAGADLTQTLLSTLLERTSGSAAAVTLSDLGISDIRDPGQRPVPVTRIVNTAARVLGDDQSVIQRLVDEPGEFSFDVHVPFSGKRGVFGDGQTVDIPDGLRDRPYTAHIASNKRKVGDVTAGGLRFGYDRKRNLAPWVQPWMMRLVCTNGMETADHGLRVDARGASVDDVLNELEQAAERAFSRVENQIRHFYDLRNQAVENPERVIRRIGRERGIPDRSIARLLDLAPTDALPDRPTMFDIVNLVTNLANDPSVRRDGGRLLLERAGGAEVSDHVARCAHCDSRTT